MNLDYSLFPTMEYGFLVTPSPDAGLKEYVDIYDRFCSAIYMASQIGAESKAHILSNKAHATSYTRAALAEFSGIDELIENNFENLKRNDYLIYKQRNPLFHIMKLLRNYNIHVAESTICDKQINVALPLRPQEVFEIKASHISNLSAESLKKLNSAKDYSISELQKMIEHFDNAQHKFGVSDLLITGVVLYSGVISRLITTGSKPFASLTRDGLKPAP